MTRRVGLLATVLLLAPLAFACGKEAEQPPKSAQPASLTPGVAASESPAVASPTVAATKAAAVAAPPAGATEAAASSPAATTTSLPQPAGTKVPVRPQPTEPQAPPPPAGATSAPPTTAPATTPAATQPAPPAGPAQQPPKGKITLPAKLGAVTFDHESHTGKRGIACTACHHSSRPQKPLASENQACRDCHAMPAAPPMKTNLQGAFHDPKGATGTCIDCHKQKGGSAPVKCLECHKRK